MSMISQEQPVSRHAFDKLRTIVFNLSGGKLKVVGMPQQLRDTDFTYLLEVERVDHKRLTKAQRLWAETTIAAVVETLRQEN